MISCVFAIHRVRVILLLPAHFNILSCIHSNSSKAKSHLWSLRPTLQRITVMLGLAISSPRCTGKGNLLKFKKTILKAEIIHCFLLFYFFSVPALPDMMKQTSVPFSLVVSPFASLEHGEKQPPLVDMGPSGSIRCGRCKVVGTRDFCRNNVFPTPPAYVFVIDVSYNNVKSGLVCHNMKTILQRLPSADQNPRVGFITYDKVVNFYNIKSTLAQPQMLVVGETEVFFYV